MKLTRQQERDVFEENLQLREAVNRYIMELDHKNRELQIEAALERVRIKAMAMHSSNELNTIIGQVFIECIKLDIQLDRGIIMIFDPESLDSWWWMANPEADLPGSYHVPFNTYEPYMAYLNGWKERTMRWTYVLEGKDKNDWDAHIFANSELSLLPNEVMHVMKSFTKVYLNASFNNFGGLTLASLDPMSDEHFDILLRFAKVFDLTYTRFNDLRLAEAQSREAQIEAALEKVRSRSLSMHHSIELEQVVVSLFDRLVELGLSLDGALIFIFDKEKRNIQLWIATNQLPMPVKIDLPFDEEIKNNAIIKDLWNAIENGDQIFNRSYTGETKNDYFQYVVKYNGSKIPESIRKIQIESDNWTANFAAEKNSLVGFDSWSGHTITIEDFQTLLRFARVFEQAYTRFLDLQKAEAQTKEAIKASSFDRVRAEIASMRTVDDLQQITPLIWQELITLGVPFVRCGMFIINESSVKVQVYLSSPDGHSLATLDLPFDSSDLILNIVIHWRNALLFKTHWYKEDLINWMQTMIREGHIQNRETYPGTLQFPESLDLHFVPFKQGMLYVGNVSPLNREELQLVKSLAESFSIAYARYEDFKQLEVAKNQIEKTLIELKATQSQLIQSEKMASLGELTAGIAHEIQNPLNFVNNFSELSNELLDDMKMELENNHLKEAIALADYIKQNLEKILHHGKRADGIVKGMLQHSRSSSGVKEPTDINKLADEYLRLAYHGSRAKDSSFNVALKTDFDPSIGTINIVPQDIGRVILNLITNAFYAVAEKAKKSPLTPGGGIYEPTVIVKTSLIPPSGGRGVWVLISVKDNGIGIPPKVLDKIFQPFFTTKPTGKGTGLGLSLSYDIVKAHGGDLKVETVEGEYTEFTIELPVR